ncbi:hypothetical protein [Burkholderia pyrrocinia]|uniref:Uncharacterized protein n=1 Tax=Burkholderia pyrrocinia TaxID=60550 RepID=A0ABZ3BQ39_BURPY
MVRNRLVSLEDEKLAKLIGEGLRVDVNRLLRDEPFVEVIPDFDSISMVEIILLVEEKEGRKFDSLIGIDWGSEGQPEFPVCISALGRAVRQVKAAVNVEVMDGPQGSRG